ncbi:MAG: hemolysin family protein, partial [Planctomycetaceae bacterium]|nr:hemolysin family protein [Planctomycetaceae bacterium]
MTVAIKKHHKRAALAASMMIYLCMSLTICGYILCFLHEQERTSLEWTGMIAVFTLVITALVVWIPATFSKLWAAPIVYYGWPIWRFLTMCLFPLELAAGLLDAFFVRLSGIRPDTTNEEQFSEEIMTIVTEGHRDGLLEDDAREMIEGVIEMSDVVVSEIMTPRTDMCSMPISLNWEEMLEFVIKAPHSRIPVYAANRDDIIGVLISKDLLTELAKPCPEYRAPWTTLLREPRFVPETKPVSTLLQEFQQYHVHLVIVLDEYGGVSGIVTLEDILEEIVGEIVDEFDPETVDGISELGDDAYQVLGKIHIDELNDRLGIGFPEDDNYDTIAGFLLDRMGRVPVQGETYDFDGIRMTIVSATRRRIETGRIEPLPDDSDN